jgi:hypothetical protein
VPDTSSGFYYDLIRGEFVPGGTTPITLKAEIVPFSIRSVTPNRIGDNGQVTITIIGARFQNGATVRLVSNGTTLTAAKVMVLDSATVKARFALSSVPHGAYDVVLANPGGTVAASPQAVTVEAATGIMVSIITSGDLTPRVGTRLEATSVLINTGNLDAPFVTVLSTFNAQVKVGWRRPAESLPRQMDFPDVDWLNDSPTASFSNGFTKDAFYVRDLAPGQQIPFYTYIT